MVSRSLLRLLTSAVIALSCTLDGVAAVTWPTSSRTCASGELYTCDETTPITLSSNVTYTNCIFQNCPILIASSNIVLTFNGVTVDGSGGPSPSTDALIRLSNSARLNATDSIFQNISTSGTSNSSYGGALYVNGAMFTGTNVAFNHNKAYQGSAAFARSSSIFLCKGCTFTGNGDPTTSNKGGALMTHGGVTASLIDSTFTDNAVYHDGGGALYLLSSTVTGSNLTFAMNKAFQGGAVQLQDFTTFECSDCNFYGDGVTSLSRSVGGAIYVNKGPLFKWTGGSCIGVGAATKGSCLFVDSTVVFRTTSATLKNIVMRDGVLGAGVMETSGHNSSIIATNVTVRNITTISSGAVIVGDGSASFADSTFQNLSANYGGVASITGKNTGHSGRCSFTNCLMENIHAITGGIIYAKELASITMHKSTVRYTRAAKSGGFASVDLGAIVTVSDSVITTSSYNTSSIGGVVALKTGSPSAGISKFHCTGSTVMTGSTKTAGGCIYNNNSTVLLTDNCTLTNCQAVSGGGIYNENSGNSTLSGNAEIKHSTAVLFGGGIYLGGPNANFHLTQSSVIRNNTAGRCGGGIDTTTDSFADDTATIKWNIAPCGPAACLRNTTDDGSTGLLHVQQEATVLGLVEWMDRRNVCNGYDGPTMTSSSATPSATITSSAADAAAEPTTALVAEASSTTADNDFSTSSAEPTFTSSVPAESTASSTEPTSSTKPTTSAAAESTTSLADPISLVEPTSTSSSAAESSTSSAEPITTSSSAAESLTSSVEPSTTSSSAAESSTTSAEASTSSSSASESSTSSPEPITTSSSAEPSTTSISAAESSTSSVEPSTTSSSAAGTLAEAFTTSSSAAESSTSSAPPMTTSSSAAESSTSLAEPSITSISAAESSTSSVEPIRTSSSAVESSTSWAEPSTTSISAAESSTSSAEPITTSSSAEPSTSSISAAESSTSSVEPIRTSSSATKSSTSSAEASTSSSSAAESSTSLAQPSTTSISAAESSTSSAEPMTTSSSAAESSTSLEPSTTSISAAESSTSSVEPIRTSSSATRASTSWAEPSTTSSSAAKPSTSWAEPSTTSSSAAKPSTTSAEASTSSSSAAESSTSSVEPSTTSSSAAESSTTSAEASTSSSSAADSSTSSAAEASTSLAEPAAEPTASSTRVSSTGSAAAAASRSSVAASPTSSAKSDAADTASTNAAAASPTINSSKAMSSSPTPATKLSAAALKPTTEPSAASAEPNPTRDAQPTPESSKSDISSLQETTSTSSAAAPTATDPSSTVSTETPTESPEPIIAKPGIPKVAVIGGAVGGATAVAAVAGIIVFSRYGKAKAVNILPSEPGTRLATINPLYVSPAAMIENPIYEVEYVEYVSEPR
ncbi:hypothetical protein DFJ77DRAFT_251342 [Powellomyces hirtus]|nr:hypothetical protein DFJ77DRAFT_251342 [Powellomyces hirtus]